jgi:hypothetical protein
MMASRAGIPYYDYHVIVTSDLQPRSTPVWHARELATETGETLTETVVIALRERLDREHAKHGASMRMLRRRGPPKLTQASPQSERGIPVPGPPPGTSDRTRRERGPRKAVRRCCRGVHGHVGTRESA